MNNDELKTKEEEGWGSVEKVHGISEKKKERERAETKAGSGKKEQEKRRTTKEDKNIWKKKEKSHTTKSGKEKKKNVDHLKARRKKEKKKSEKEFVLYSLNRQSTSGRPRSAKSDHTDSITINQGSESERHKWVLPDFAPFLVSCQAIQQLTDRLEKAVGKFELLANAFAQMGLIVQPSYDGATDPPANESTEALLNLDNDFSHFAPVIMENEMQTMPDEETVLAAN